MKDWKEFQNYKDREPPWIKLHRRLHTKTAWRKLHGSAAKLLIDVWCMAAGAKTGGELTDTLEDLAYQLRAPEEELRQDLEVLEAHGFLELCLQPSAVVRTPQAKAVPEERRAEPEERQRQRQKSPSVAPQTENWMLPFGKAWTARFQGTTPWGRIGKALKPLRDQHPDTVILQRWERFLAQARAGVSTPEGFAQTFGDWKPLTLVANTRIGRDVAIRRALEVLHSLDDKRMPRDGFDTPEAFERWLATEVERQAAS